MIREFPFLSLSPCSISEGDSCSGLQERNFSASLSTVLRDCNNTDLPHRDVVRLFLCKALGKVQRDEYYYHLDLMSSLVPRALGWGEDDHLK